jgi:PD-(D/E)XK nuclease superfamily protein
VSQAQLSLYRFAEDAWAGGLRAWCERASRAALEGAHCWLVVAARGQAQWIRRRALDDGLTLFGIRFFEASLLRQELCALLDVEAGGLGRETLEFLLKTEASNGDDESLAIRRNAGACLRALDDLGAAGWHTDRRARQWLPAGSRPLLRTLAQSRSWTPALDAELFEKSATCAAPLLTCFFGWDAGHWPHGNLLRATARASRECAVFAPSPRPAAQSLRMDWINAVEAWLGVEHSVCADSGFESSNETLVARLERIGERDPVRIPVQLIAGRRWADEIDAVRDHVLAWLAAELSGRLAIVVPRRSPSSAEIIRQLAAAGVVLLDNVGERTHAEPEQAIQLAIARYHAGGHDVGALLDVVRQLNERAGERWAWLNPEDAHGELHEAFAAAQSRNARLLAGRLDDNGAAARLAQLIEHLGRWPERLGWNEARRRWEECVGKFGLATDVIEPLWSRAGELLGAREISARDFFEYLIELLSGTGSRRAPKADEPYARVVVTTFAQAADQSWDALVFLDANEGIWPLRATENPFLDDDARASLNATRGGKFGRLLTSRDADTLEEARMLDLLENCRGQVAFAFAQRDAVEHGRESYPNEWALRCIVESSSGFAPREALKNAQRAVAVHRRAPAPLDAGERDHFAAVHASRLDRARPFDEFLFDFHGIDPVERAWAAGDLDGAVNCPATFALKQIFHAEPVDDYAFARSEPWAVGRLAHAWIAHALGGSSGFAPFTWSDDVPLRLRDATLSERHALAELFAAEQLELPVWWLSVLKKTEWSVRGCLDAVRELGLPFFATEFPLNVEVATPSGTLKLRGRADFIASDRSELAGAAVQIVDFKTGGTQAPSMSSLGKGHGHQFASYRLMARDLGAASARVGIARPDEVKLELFADADDAALREIFAPLARLQREMRFGRRGALVARYGACETLPVATRAIEPEVLAAKGEMTNVE